MRRDALSHYLNRARARRIRRRRLRGRMVPAEAQQISTRTRWERWPLTKAITRQHRLEKRGT